MDDSPLRCSNSTSDDEWKDADFLSFGNEEKGNGNKKKSKTNNTQCTPVRPRTSVHPLAQTKYSKKYFPKSDVKLDCEMPPWMEETKRSKKRPPLLVELHNEIVSFVSLMKPQKEEIETRDNLVKEVSKIVVDTFGGSEQCKVVVFGSQATRLFLPSSDVDLVVQIKGHEQNDPTKITPPKKEKKVEDDVENWDAPTGTLLERVARALQKAWPADHISYLELIENTRIPIVKLTHAPTNISIDICFNQPGGPEAAELMNTFLQDFPPLRPLCFVLKYFMVSRVINEPYTGGIGSFMLQMMIVSFLQQRAREAYNSGDMDMYQQNLGSLLLEFFELYGIDFNYFTTGISVRNGGSYFPKGARGRRDNFWQPSRPFSLALENPLDSTLDVGKGSYRMKLIQHSFSWAFQVLLAHLSEPKVPTNATGGSILAMILPPTEEMKARALVQKVLNEPKDKEGSVTQASSGKSRNGEKRGRKRRK